MKIGRDKYLHFAVCGIISTTIICTFILIGSTLPIAILTGTVATIGTGLGKEYGDKMNPNSSWDWKDILADFCGLLLGIIVNSIFWLIIK